VFAQRRNISHPRLGVGERDGGQQCLDLSVLRPYGAPPVPGPQLVVVDNLLQRFDLGGGDPGGGQAVIESLARPANCPGTYRSVALRAVPDPLDVRGEEWIDRKLRGVQHLGRKSPPPGVVLDPDEYLAVAGRE
jgi:hypothetical protein